MIRLSRGHYLLVNKRTSRPSCSSFVTGLLLLLFRFILLVVSTMTQVGRQSKLPGNSQLMVSKIICN